MTEQKYGFIYMIIPDFKLWYRTDDIRTQLIKYCTDNNIVILNEFTDTSGGTISKRANLIEMLSLLERGHYVICSTITQLSWDTEHLLAIKKHINRVGGNLIILDLPIDFSTSIGDYLFSTAAIIDKYKIDMIEEIIIEEGINSMSKIGWSIIGGEYIKRKGKKLTS